MLILTHSFLALYFPINGINIYKLTFQHYPLCTLGEFVYLFLLLKANQIWYRDLEAAPLFWYRDFHFMPGLRKVSANMCRLKKCINKKGPISFTRCIPTLQKLNELAYKTLPHPLYSSDLSPTDYRLFKHLDNFLREIYFKSRVDAEMIFNFIVSRTPEFCATGINKVVSRWQKCVESNGTYFDS